MVNLYTIHSPNTPLVLGLPWLEKNNPTINWKTRVFEFQLDRKTSLNAIFGVHGAVNSETESDNSESEVFFDPINDSHVEKTTT
ncbi:hypothetical protein AYI70_g6348 [Smittium culicis]|uniref:Uncharacterized protein n=1 Tax=Smittium culicis TaxID=133412 RepID=A0A1R1XQB0_9FUNG|nr:hypothetical protein AYI70_g6348 [Smittium culicis]